MIVFQYINNYNSKIESNALVIFNKTKKVKMCKTTKMKLSFKNLLKELEILFQI